MDCATDLCAKLRVYMAKSHGGMVVCMVLTFGFSMLPLLSPEIQCEDFGWKQPVSLKAENRGRGFFQARPPYFLQVSDIPICRAPLFPSDSPRWSLTFSSLRHADCIFPGGRWDIERPEMAHRMLSILNCTNYRFMLKWWCPKIGLPLNHPFTSMLSPF